MFLPLILVSVLSVGPTQTRAHQDELAIVRGWIADVLDHQPGVIDKPLLDIATQSPESLNIVRRQIRDVLKVERVPVRNDILRRGALVHTDIALLLPERAAEYLQTDADEPFIFDKSGRLVVNRRDTGKLVRSRDGEYVASEVENAHWSMARGLLHDIYPHPSADEFVQRWYRAFAAFFEESSLLGNAKYHRTRALEELPRDPMILFYAGAMHEAYASWGVQSIPMTRPGLTAALRLPSPQEEWSLAEPLLREAVKAGAPAEARLRHARVLGRLGKHAEAAAMLRLLEPGLTDPRLKYFAALFLGSEEGALGEVNHARDAFERAAVLCPTAQAPLVAMADLFRRSGNRTAALAVLGRIQALPSDPAERVDPWVDYFRSFALDATDQVEAVRAWVSGKEP